MSYSFGRMSEIRLIREMIFFFKKRVYLCNKVEDYLSVKSFIMTVSCVVLSEVYPERKEKP